MHGLQQPTRIVSAEAGRSLDRHHRRLRRQLQGYVVKATIAATAACIPTVTLSYLPTTSRHHFATEIGRIRASTASSPPPLINDRVVDQTLSDLAPVTADEVMEILQKSPAKQCKLDPVPTWLVKRASHVLAPVIAAVCNASFQQLTMQHVYRATVVARLTYAASAWRGFTKASDRQRINSVIDCARVLYSAPGALVTARRIHRRLMNCATLRTMNYSAKLFNCRSMYCTHHYHHHPPPHNAITSDTVRTPYSCLNIQHNYPILISEHACHIRTHVRLSSLVYFSSKPAFSY